MEDTIFAHFELNVIDCIVDILSLFGVGLRFGLVFSCCVNLAVATLLLGTLDQWLVCEATRESAIHLDVLSWLQAVQITGKIMHPKLVFKGEIVDLEKHQSQLGLTNLLPFVLNRPFVA